MNVLVIGASRGIGLEFARQYLADGAAVTATARDAAGTDRLRGLGATALVLDVTDATGVARLPAQLGTTRFDVAIVNAGVNNPRVGPLDAPSEADFDHVMRTNVLGPMRLLAPLAKVLAAGGRLAILSSRMGSIGSRTEAGSLLYRASKAAVNSVLKDASLVLRERAICVAFHPGWVRTDMGGAAAAIDVETSVAGMRRVIASLAPVDSGSFRNHDGEPIAW